MKKSNKKPTLVDLLNDTEKLLQYVNDLNNINLEDLNLEEMESHLNNINLKNIVEMTDETDLKDQVACAGGLCEI